MDYEKGSAILKVLGHPARLQMMEGIAKYGCHVNKIAEKLGLPQSTVSQHLAALRYTGLVTFEKKGTMACYKITDKRVMKIIKILGELS